MGNKKSMRYLNVYRVVFITNHTKNMKSKKIPMLKVILMSMEKI